MSSQGIPIACTLDEASLAKRRSGLLASLVARATAREAQPDGMVLRFDPQDDLLALIAEVIDAERRCCRFLTFHLTVGAGQTPIELRLTGPSGTREFLAGLFEPEIP